MQLDILPLRTLGGGWASWARPAAAAVPSPSNPQTRFGIPKTRLGIQRRFKLGGGGTKNPGARFLGRNTRLRPAPTSKKSWNFSESLSLWAHGPPYEPIWARTHGPGPCWQMAAAATAAENAQLAQTPPQRPRPRPGPHNFKNVSLVGGRGCPHGIFYPCERWRGRGAGPAGCAPPPPLLSPGLGRPKRVLGSPIIVCDPQTLRGVPQIQGRVLWWENACGPLPRRKSCFCGNMKFAWEA